jgi:hypothetical protein
MIATLFAGALLLGACGGPVDKAAAVAEAACECKDEACYKAAMEDAKGLDIKMSEVSEEDKVKLKALKSAMKLCGLQYKMKK